MVQHHRFRGYRGKAVGAVRDCCARGKRSNNWTPSSSSSARIWRLSGGCEMCSLGGHGIGRAMHEPPHVPHVGQRGAGLCLREGMVITIEPMINLGGPGVRQLDDGWTIVTADGSLSAQFEHTVLVTRSGCEILTVGPAS